MLGAKTQDGVGVSINIDRLCDGSTKSFSWTGAQGGGKCVMNPIKIFE